MTDIVCTQVISLLKDAFTDAGLGLYLAPYGCIPTGYECGILEVVPNCQSRWVPNCQPRWVPNCQSRWVSNCQSRWVLKKKPTQQRYNERTDQTST